MSDSEHDPLTYFWQHVDTSGDCWLWTGKTSGKGYGYLFIGRQHSKSGQIGAHRFAASLYLADYDPALFVCHTCDEPRCVRLEHLFMGTPTDNVRDMVAKGRQMWGGKCKRGHDLSLTGVPANRGRRRCGICLADYREIRLVS